VVVSANRPASYVFIAVDYSQVEMRVMAHLCNDPALCKLFHSDGDVYVSMASQVFGVPPHVVSPEQRRQAKTVSLGILYGIGVNEAAKKLGVDVSTASRIRSQFLQRFPAVGRFMESVKRYAQSNGYIVTMAQRRRYLPDIGCSDDTRRLQSERQAINSVVQGSASDLLKLALVTLQSLFQFGDPLPPDDVVSAEQLALLRHASIVLQIHDELIVQCPADEATCVVVARAVRWCMEVIAPRRLHQLATRAPQRLLTPRTPVGGVGAIANADGDVNDADIAAAMTDRWNWLGVSVSDFVDTVPLLRVPLTVTVSVGSSWGTMSPMPL
jgi:DNA polymerase I-like protein with 3'-5' exonuclease and polymerase domains